jgi:hypothetical protein
MFVLTVTRLLRVRKISPQDETQILPCRLRLEEAFGRELQST